MAAASCWIFCAAGGQGDHSPGKLCSAGISRAGAGRARLGSASCRSSPFLRWPSFFLECGRARRSRLDSAELAATGWSPQQGQYGVALLLAGTLAVTALALFLACRSHSAAAGYLALSAGGKVRAAANAAIGTLGRHSFGRHRALGHDVESCRLFGNSWISASVALALMIVPTITLLSGAALRLVPADLLEASRALGMSEGIVARVAFHHARWGYSERAVVLGTSRAPGKAVAVSMVARERRLLAFPHAADSHFDDSP